MTKKLVLEKLASADSLAPGTIVLFNPGARGTEAETTSLWLVLNGTSYPGSYWLLELSSLYRTHYTFRNLENFFVYTTL